MIKVEFGEYPEMNPVCDDNGTPWYHMNLYSNEDIPTLKYEVQVPKHPVNILL